MEVEEEPEPEDGGSSAATQSSGDFIVVIVLSGHIVWAYSGGMAFRKSLMEMSNSHII